MADPHDQDDFTPTHQVTGPLAIVPTTDGQSVYIYEGGPLPPNVSDEAIEHLVSTGLVHAVSDLDEAGRPKANFSGGDVEAARSVPQPSPAAPKADWVDYAISQGYERSVAEAMTKGDLVARFPAR